MKKTGILNSHISKILSDLGHDTYGFVGDIADYRNLYRRYEGFSAILTEAKKEIILFDSELTKMGGQQVAKKIFDSKATAVFCSNDLIAVGVYEQAHRHSIPLPEKLSIVGFDDISFSEILHPKLTTVKQPLEKMAEIAVVNLLNMIQDRHFSFDTVRLPVELLVRDSTGKPRHLK